MAKTNSLKDFIVLNLDLKAAFDSPTSSYLQETSRYIGIPEKLINYFDIQHKYTNAKLFDTDIDPIPIHTGVFQ